MICKRLILDYKKDLKNWGLFFLGIIAIFIISYIESGDLQDSFFSIAFLLAFMSAVIAIYDVLSLVFFRESVGYYWLICLLSFAFFIFPMSLLGTLVLNDIFLLLLMAFAISIVLLVFVWYASRRR